MIKYLGSKRTLVPVLGHIAAASEAKTALDLFTGTTRVARAFKQQGIHVTTVDTASYSEVFGKTWIQLDSNDFDHEGLESAILKLNQISGQAGYFTKKFCEEARFFQPVNGERVDAIREAIEADYQGTELYFPLLTSLILATDKLDSTTGVQMAFLKQWTQRSNAALQMKDPELIAGQGLSYLADATKVISELPEVDLAYLDPPYNQHRYFGNYHIWESLVRWDKPETYGVANKRIDTRSEENRSAFNSRKTMPQALEKVLLETKAKNLILSFNNESWITADDLIEIAKSRGHVKILDIDFKRYVGSKIGVYNKAGDRVGEPGTSRNTEHLLICGEEPTVERMYAAGMKFK
jgi:adenine-specific DNA-methyltransferase